MLRSMKGPRENARASRFCVVTIAVLALLATSRTHAQAAETSPAWTVMGQAGGTLVKGEIEHWAGGHRVRTADDHPRLMFDVRGTLTRAIGRWFALSAQLGLTNWQSEYRHMAGYRRSNFVTAGLSPELRVPLGRCIKCPLLYAGPRAGAIVSQRDRRAPRASVEEEGLFGFGGVAGGRAGLRMRVSRRHALGVALEVGVEKIWLRHEVHLTGVGSETQRFVMLRAVQLAGFWWSL
jgi:hypothetical protein